MDCYTPLAPDLAGSTLSLCVCAPSPFHLQIPLQASTPPTDAPLRMSSLDDAPRLSCASLLVRIMTPGGC